ncbi:MAG: AzlC family ABC transporter permease [Alphaproteobacteria bacterium]|nr:AzlC family ABC transporter permease [Alphaproteobacteria bacterium]MBF0250881.1 AzlC family ABC transporter permease [Alphaproteobacteria bacterium]
MSKPDATLPISSPRAAFWLGAREAARVPMAVMAASFLGFGTLIRDLDWSVWLGVYSTISTWALPGQIAMAEMAARGAPLASMVLAVAFINARLMPMVASLLPQVRRPGMSLVVQYAAAMIIAATTWAGVMRRLPDLRTEVRFAYLTGYGGALYAMSPFATAAGYFLADHVAREVAMGLVFLNPLYFMLLFLAGPGNTGRWLALGFGAALGPMLYTILPDWSLVLTGLLGGTAAWLIGRRRARHG